MVSPVDLLADCPHLIADSSLAAHMHTLRGAPYSGGRSVFDYAAYEKSVNDGARIFLTNTFDTNRFRLKTLQLEKDCQELNYCAAYTMRQAVSSYGQPVAIAGNIGPIGYAVPYEEAVAGFAEQAQSLLEGGVDMLWLESFFTVEGVLAAVAGCGIGAPGLPLVVTVAFRPNSPSIPSTILQQSNAFAIGVDAGGSEPNLLPQLQKMRAAAPHAILAAKTHVDVLPIGSTCTSSIELMAQFARDATQAGAQIIGACRRSTPAHIDAMTQAIKGKEMEIEAEDHYVCT